MHNLKTRGHIQRMDIQYIEQLLYYQRYSLRGLELHDKFNWIDMAQDMHQSFSDTTLCLNTASPSGVHPRGGEGRPAISPQNIVSPLQEVSQPNSNA